MELFREDIDLLDRFVRNELTEYELTALKARMKEESFKEEVKNHLSDLSIVDQAGRNELKKLFTSIERKALENNTLENYNPSKFNKGGGGFTSIIIAAIVITIATILFFNKAMREKIHHVFPDEQAIDTIYHHNIKRDTIIKSDTSDSSSKVTRTFGDTIYIPSKIMVQDSTYL